ncbi:MAG: LCP family protein, partial [Christensenellales bacterium]
NEGAQRADTILIATVGYNKLRLTSVMRDTLVDIPGHGKQKLNAAYSYGGAQLTARALNESFGLNITKYMVVDFAALADIINAIGGVEIAITKSEQTQINQNVQDSWKVFGQMGYSRNATHALDLNFTNAGADGRVTAHLDGIQALGYARIRKIDSDFTRTHRQRTLMNAALQKFRGNFYHPLTAYRLARALVGRLETNMNAVELASIGIKAALRPEAEQLRLPIDGSYIDNGSTLTNVDFEKNREAFYEFAY